MNYIIKDFSDGTFTQSIATIRYCRKTCGQDGKSHAHQTGKQTKNRIILKAPGERLLPMALAVIVGLGCFVNDCYLLNIP